MNNNNIPTPPHPPPMMMRPQRHGDDDDDPMAIMMDHDAETRMDDAKKLLYAKSRYRPKPARAGQRTNAMANDTAASGMGAFDHYLADHPNKQ